MLSLFVLGGICGQCPVPSRPTGLLWGDVNAPISIEMFGDPLCPDCLEIWPKVQEIIALYKNDISFRLHLLPLPYHTWGFVVTRVAMAVKSISEEKAKNMLNLLYTGEQDKFQNDVLAATGETENTKNIINWAAEKLNIDADEITKAFKTVDANMAARIEFKFAGVHGVAGTPTIYINGVETSIGPETTIEEWKEIIDGLN